MTTTLIVALVFLAALLSAGGLLAWRTGRGGPRTVPLDEPFDLKAGQTVQVDRTTLRLGEDGASITTRDGLEERKVVIESLPMLIGYDGALLEIRRLSDSEAVRLVASRFTGIRVELEASTLSWERAMAASSSPERPEERDFRPYPHILLRGTYAFDTAALRASGGSAWAVGQRIVLVLRYANGVEQATNTQALQRSQFTAHTGIHPSYALDPPPPVDHQPPARIGGRFTADVGVMLAKPDRPEEITVFAAFGPYRSNDLLLRLEP